MKYLVLYNPLSCCGHGEDNAHSIIDLLPGKEVEFIDITKVCDYVNFFLALNASDYLIICGGDGTLNQFVNKTTQIDIAHDIYYYPCGTGNDFYRDIKEEDQPKIVNITKYLRDLPIVIVNGKQYRFLNNVGFGIDGYCTQVGDEMRKNGKSSINYAAIAIKGILGCFSPVTSTVTVDGSTSVFKHTWLSPTMNGRYYGGGMMPAPDQNRIAEDKTVSVMVYHSPSRLKSLIVFPSIFKGEHIKHTNMVKTFHGKSIHVSFNKPCPLQIDGETIKNVSEYYVFSTSSN